MWRQGLGNSKEQTRVLVEEASLEPVRLGETSKAISPHEKAQEGKVSIKRY